MAPVAAALDRAVMLALTGRARQMPERSSEPSILLRVFAPQDADAKWPSLLSEG